MIIQIRGTSGSGKTTAMRSVMGTLSFWNAKYREGRKKPLYYEYAGPEPWGGGYQILLLGHYEESACGGCDTIGSARAVYDLIMSMPAKSHILCEGLLLSEDTKWTLELANQDVRAFFLTTTADECVKRIYERRKAAGNDKELNETNTRKRVDVIERARKKLTESGLITVRRCSSDQAPKLIENLLRTFKS